MRFNRLHGLVVATLLPALTFSSTGASAAEGEPTSQPREAAPQQAPLIELTLRPSPVQRSALKPAFTYRFTEQHKENAVPLYMKAFLLIAESNTDQETWKKIADWTEMPVNELPRDEVRQTLARFSAALHQVDVASRRLDADWALPVREEENVFSILLPEVQIARDTARVLAAKARLEIAEGKLNEAIGTLRTGLALARHVADAPFLINGLVGIAIANMMCQQIETLAEAPDSPNLYWALTYLPNPLIDLKEALAVEADSIDLIVPEMRRSARAYYLPQQWDPLLEVIVGRLDKLKSDFSEAQPDAKPPALPERVRSIYPQARQALIELGYEAAAVDAMPQSQVVLLDTFERYEAQRDAMFKVFYLPHLEAEKYGKKAEAELKQQGGTNDLLPVLREVIPSVFKCRLAVTRIQVRIALLRGIEAIRLHAAETGRLPTRLDEMSTTPVPTNPLTDRPFHYELKEGAALFGAPGPNDGLHRQYRLTLAGSK